jgi:hypothetical protein
MIFGSVFLAVAGIALAGAVAEIPLWLVALLLAAIGIASETPALSASSWNP